MNLYIYELFSNNFIYFHIQCIYFQTDFRSSIYLKRIIIRHVLHHKSHELVLQISRYSISVINTGIIISYRQTGNIRYQVKLIHRGKSFIGIINLYVSKDKREWRRAERRAMSVQIKKNSNEIRSIAKRVKFHGNTGCTLAYPRYDDRAP